jgi:hypothetical protein
VSSGSGAAEQEQEEQQHAAAVAAVALLGAQLSDILSAHAEGARYLRLYCSHAA